MNYKIVKWPESQNFMDREDCFEVPDLESQAYIVPENVYNEFFKKTEEVIWSNDLIMCPSQCYAYFTSEDKSYCIYLRWRWDDPWTAELVPITPSGEFEYSDEWLTLDVNDYSHDNFRKLQRECVEIVKCKFKDIKWNTQYRV